MGKRSLEALRARDRGRTGEPMTPHARHPEFPPYRGDLATPPAPARTYWLRRHHAHLEPPTPDRPYFTVRSAHHAFLGAGRDPERAVWNAMRRLRLKTRS